MLKFINREAEIWQIHEYLSDPPNYVLFVYGPKSSGKSTLMTKIARGLGNFVYYDFRARSPSDIVSALAVERPGLIARFRRFLKSKITGSRIYDGVEVEKKVLEKMRKGEVDPFVPLIPAIKKMNYPVLVLDEIQALEYAGIEKEKISQILNFLVTITKRMHLTHAIVVTSDCLFIEKAVKLAALEETAEYLYVGDLPKRNVIKWMKEEGMSAAQARRVWEVVGGRPYELWVVVHYYHSARDLAILDKIVARKKARIEFLVGGEEKYRKVLKRLAKGEIKAHEVKREILEWLIKNEIAFFDPINGSLIPLSQSTKIALEQMFL